MKASLIWFAFISTLISQAPGGDLPPVNDGNEHGDPPFLLEDGWKPLLNGKDLDGWRCVDPRREGSWMATKGVYWAGTNAPRKLIGRAEPGDRIVNTVRTNGASNLMSTEKMSDFELYVEFMIPANSNSGVYLHGLYEMQIWDSDGIAEHAGSGNEPGGDAPG